MCNPETGSHRHRRGHVPQPVPQRKKLLRAKGQRKCRVHTVNGPNRDWQRWIRWKQTFGRENNCKVPGHLGRLSHPHDRSIGQWCEDRWPSSSFSPQQPQFIVQKMLVHIHTNLHINMSCDGIIIQKKLIGHWHMFGMWTRVLRPTQKDSLLSPERMKRTLQRTVT